LDCFLRARQDGETNYVDLPVSIVSRLNATLWEEVRMKIGLTAIDGDHFILNNVQTQQASFLEGSFRPSYALYSASPRCPTTIVGLGM